jgi:hypothetical protein
MHPIDLGRQALESIALFAAAMFVADIVHYGLHVAARSRISILARVGAWHGVHHRFLDTDLRIHREVQTQNLLYHRVPEYLTRVLATSIGFAFLPRGIVVLVLAAETVAAVVGTVQGGIDSNHRETPVLRSKSGWLVGPVYHGFHHAYPDNYMGSETTLFDVVFAKGCQLRGRHFALTGASGAFGAPLAEMLEASGGRVTRLKYGRDYDYGDYDRLDPVLADADVLVLCHGSKVDRAMQANCDSFVGIIERFRHVGRARRLPVEVWAVGSEIEAHPSWGDPDLEIYLRSKRAFARYARRYFHDSSMVYRHIVPSAYTSPMGKGLISGRAAAAIAMFFIRRGFRYVPVTYTGIALLNWLKFVGPVASRQATLPGPQ